MLSPTSIANFLACQHLTALDRAAEAKQIKRPFFADPLLDFLIKLGEAHEQAYLTQLTEQGLTIVEIPTDGSRRDAAAKQSRPSAAGLMLFIRRVFWRIRMGIAAASGRLRSSQCRYPDISRNPHPT